MPVAQMFLTLSVSAVLSTRELMRICGIVLTYSLTYRCLKISSALDNEFTSCPYFVVELLYIQSVAFSGFALSCSHRSAVDPTGLQLSPPNAGRELLARLEAVPVVLLIDINITVSFILTRLKRDH